MRTKQSEKKKSAKRTGDNEPRKRVTISKTNNATEDITFAEMQEALTGLYD